jgi:hypothetical protein
MAMTSTTPGDPGTGGSPLYDEVATTTGVGADDVTRTVPPAPFTTPAPATTDATTSSAGAGGSGSSGSGRADAAKEQAGAVASDAKESGKQVAADAKDQASRVAGETKRQARDLYDQTTTQLRDQAGTQQKRVASGLRSVGDELSSMSRNSEQGGLAAELTGQVGERAGQVAGWLDDRDPGSLLDEVRGFAARRPGAFIAIAVGAGLIAGRLTRGLIAEAKEDSPSSSTRASDATADLGSRTDLTDRVSDDRDAVPASGYLQDPTYVSDDDRRLP